jgi:hypothetical protein
VSSHDRAAVAVALAAALLSADWSVPDAMARRGSAAIGVGAKRVVPVVDDVLAAYRDPPVDRRRELTAYLQALDSYQKLWRKGRRPDVKRHLLPVAQVASQPWPVPAIATVAELAEWADLAIPQLDWYADVRSLERGAERRLQHYDRHWVYSRRGQARLLESPRPRLKALQRRMLHEILDAVPVHGAAHGFVTGRSVTTYAAPHVGRDVVVHLDLEAFFATITAGRVFGVLRSMGYPEAVAHLLTGLATTVVPLADRRAAPQALRDEDLDRRRRLLHRLAQPHLPQGSPTSPALANLVAFRLDARLAGLAMLAGACYTRYADDLALSLSGPDASRRARRLVDVVGRVAREEGFRVNQGKTRLTSRSQRQQLCGVVVNERAGVARVERDRLRAILHRCITDGPQSQNRDGHQDYRAHLTGRVAWVSAVNPAQGARLQHLLLQISW